MKRSFFVLGVVVLLVLMCGPVQAYILGPTTPGKWGDPTLGTGASITYSFMASGIATDNGFTSDLAAAFFTGWEAEIARAFDAWADVADLTFTLVADTGEAFNTAGSSGDIRIGMEVFDGSGGTYGHGFFPPTNGGTAAGDIHLDSAETWKLGFGGAGFSLFQVMTQQIGHALGLAHDDSEVALMNPGYSEDFEGLLADDIAGIQYIYGARAPEPVPEPATILLFGTGLVALVGSRIRKKKQQ